MPDRTYSFALPVTIPGFYVPVIGQKIINDGLWGHVPHALQVKIHNAWAAGAPLALTKADLDSISDADWAVVQRNLSA